MYHEVSDKFVPGFGKYIVRPRLFEAQISWLARAGYTSVSLDSLLAARAGGTTLPPKPVIITFDDAYEDSVRFAVPVLRAHDFTAIYYLITGWMGSVTRFKGVEVRLPLIDWPQARRLIDAGFHCGSHTVTHPHLAETSPDWCRDELVKSRQRMRDRLGIDVHHLAYPHGSYDEAVMQASAAAGYRSAVSVRIGLSPHDDDPLRLHRVPIEGQESLLDFKFRVLTAHSPGELLRKRAARRLLRGVGVIARTVRR